MTERASPTAIGAFVLGGLALLVIALVVLGGSALFAEHRSFVCYFDTSVKGLSVGSAVRYRGVEVGRVASSRAVFDPDGMDHQTPVTIDLRLDAMPGIRRRSRTSEWETELRRHVDAGLRAQLALDSLITGSLFVALEYHDEAPPTFRGDGAVPEVPTIPSNLEQLVTTFQEIPFEELFDNAVHLLDTLDGLASGELTSALGSVERTMGTFEERVGSLTADAERLIEEARGLVAALDAKAGPLSEATLALAGDTRELVGRVDARVGPLADALEATLGDLRALTREGDGQFARLASSAEALVGTADATLGGELALLLTELERAARGVRGLVEALERRPEMFLGGKR